MCSFSYDPKLAPPAFQPPTDLAEARRRYAAQKAAAAAQEAATMKETFASYAPEPHYQPPPTYNYQSRFIPLTPAPSWKTASGMDVQVQFVHGRIVTA
ncbi:hypothetical protein EX30DRAFT_185659 [Ascodesmis nigricans]|uniref:Uncharacterized protein n=1 Tax=Ascodesmis nigricans TaxID=341454 RepID=A0A4S2N0C1_9PEZI|nr:hypothetical protein EX30DRAFT_185659 [Ascodesmis nigricans]